jgi:Rrf2 family protein
MKLTSQEEYGLRCLLHVARRVGPGTMTIPEISGHEGISTFYAAKLLRVLRRAGFLKSVRGAVGGYELARPAEQIYVSEVLTALGGRLFDDHFCEEHAGHELACSHSVDCSVRTLWRTVQLVVDQVLSKITLKDLEAHDEREMLPFVCRLVNISPQNQAALEKQVLEGRN